MNKDILQLLKENKVKITNERREIIRVLGETQSPLTPANIFLRIHSSLTKANLTTVYRNIEMLEGLGILKRLSFNKESFSYELTTNRNHHHHVVCRNCGKVEDLDTTSAEEVIGKISQKTNFKIEDHNLEFFGLCKECQNES